MFTLLDDSTIIPEAYVVSIAALLSRGVVVHFEYFASSEQWGNARAAALVHPHFVELIWGQKINDGCAGKLKTDDSFFVWALLAAGDWAGLCYKRTIMSCWISFDHTMLHA